MTGKDIDVGKCVDMLQGLILFLEEYRNNGFEIAKSEAEKIALELEIEPTFRESRVRRRKKFFEESATDEPIQVAEESFRVNYFLVMVDTIISSVQTRFVQFKKYEEIFGFLFDLGRLRGIDDESMKNACATLENVLGHDNNSDVDGLELFSELQLLRKSLPEKISKPIEVLEYIRNMHFAFPNTWIAYRIILTILVTVVTTIAIKIQEICNTYGSC